MVGDVVLEEAPRPLFIGGQGGGGGESGAKAGEAALSGFNGVGAARRRDGTALSSTGGASTATAGGTRARGRMGRVGRRSTGAGELCTGVNGGGVRVRLGTVVRSALRGGKRARTHACARPGAGVAWRGTALGTAVRRPASRSGAPRHGERVRTARVGLAWRDAPSDAFVRVCARTGGPGQRARAGQVG